MIKKKQSVNSSLSTANLSIDLSLNHKFSIYNRFISKNVDLQNGDVTSKWRRTFKGDYVWLRMFPPILT